MSFNATASGLIPKVYSNTEKGGVVVISVAGLLSITAPLLLLATATLRVDYRYTHCIAYFTSLLVANTLQSIGTVLNFRWVSQGAITPGEFCTAQGGIKQAGNVGTALWSFFISVHLFNLLFLRYPDTKTGMFAALVLGWALVGTIVLVGPATIQKSQIGPYFGVSGLWCWIAKEYPLPRFYLEYFFEFLSAGFGFILYTAILLRVRGNLCLHDGRWRLRFLARGNGWRLLISRDVIDASMAKVAVAMVWYPVAYSLLILPVALSRLISFTGQHVPTWATILCDFIFNLTGFVNVVLFICTRRLLPDTNTLPSFAMPRKEIDPESSEANGITPFTLAGSTSSASDEKSIDVISPAAPSDLSFNTGVDFRRVAAPF